MEAAERFLRSAERILDESPEAVPLLAHRALEHMIMALAYHYTPEEAGLLNTHGRRRSWISRMIHDGKLPYRLLQIFDELTRIYKRSTYLLENGELAKRSLKLAEEALGIVKEILEGGIR